jgi:hypothetical protein
MVQEEEEVISAHRKEVEDTMEIVREVMILTYSLNFSRYLDLLKIPRFPSATGVSEPSLL